MRKNLFAVVVGMLVAGNALAQSFSPVKVTKLTSYHATVGTATALAIPAVSVGGNGTGFQICNDAVNTSTYLFVGQAADVSTDGVMLGLGQCYVCEGCSSALLKAMKVLGQAAANGYSVVQYRN
jgi:hypothetical protein